MLHDVWASGQSSGEWRGQASAEEPSQQQHAVCWAARWVVGRCSRCYAMGLGLLTLCPT